MNKAAVAVLEVISVKKIEAVLTIKQMTQVGRASRTVSLSAHQEEKPDQSSELASARAKPPPIRTKTPQGSVFSVDFQSKRDLECFEKGFPKILNFGAYVGNM